VLRHGSGTRRLEKELRLRFSSVFLRPTNSASCVILTDYTLAIWRCSFHYSILFHLNSCFPFLVYVVVFFNFSLSVFCIEAASHEVIGFYVKATDSPPHSKKSPGNCKTTKVHGTFSSYGHLNHARRSIPPAVSSAGWLSPILRHSNDIMDHVFSYCNIPCDPPGPLYFRCLFL
jgi:hypothetical protein